MPVDLDKIRALLASVAGFTEGPWRMSIENGSGIVAGHRHAVVSADSSALGWPVVLVEQRSRPVMLAAPDLHRELTEAVGEIERLREELEKPVAGEWHWTNVRRCAQGEIVAAARELGWYALDDDGEMVASGPETGDAGRHAADLALIAAGYRLVGGAHPLPVAAECKHKWKNVPFSATGPDSDDGRDGPVCSICGEEWEVPDAR